MVSARGMRLRGGSHVGDVFARGALVYDFFASLYTGTTANKRMHVPNAP